MKDRGSSEQSGLALYMQSVKKCYVRETDAVRLKVTTWCIGKTRQERHTAKERGRDPSGSLPDGKSLQEHKEKTSGNALL